MSGTPIRAVPANSARFRLKLIGTYGLKNKREVWRLQMTLAKLR